MDTFRFTTTLRQGHKNNIFSSSNKYGLYSNSNLNANLKGNHNSNNGDSSVPKRSSSPFGSNSSLSGNSMFIISADDAKSSDFGFSSDESNGDSNERPPPCGAKTLYNNHLHVNVNPNHNLTTSSASMKKNNDSRQWWQQRKMVLWGQNYRLKLVVGNY